MGLILPRLGAMFVELRRRHVFRVAAVYAGVSYALVQIADTWLTALGLPDWTVTLVAVMTALGFPIALVLAWALEVTPSGIRKTPAAPGPVDVGPAEEDHPGGSARRAAADPHSVAVLPFANLSHDPENAYLCEGISEELLNALARVPGLRVVSRIRAQGGGAGESPSARDLGVATILDGSLRRAGSRLRLRAQLTDAGGQLLWSEIYEREIDDLFALEDELAHAIAVGMRITLPGTADQPVVRRGTRDLEAYQLYLKGRYYWNRRTGPDLRRAISAFEAAVRRDPSYAQAHTGLADSYNILVDYGLAPPGEALRQAEHAARNALRLNPALSEAHVSLALIQQFARNWPAAEESFTRALDSDPANAIAHHRYAFFLACMGRVEEAKQAIATAQRLDPDSLIIRTSVGWVQYYAREYPEAETHLGEIIQGSPGFAPAHLALGMVLGQLGSWPQAVEAFRASLRLAGESPATQALLAHALGRAGERDEALQLLHRLEAAGTRSYVPPFYLAVGWLGLSEVERALGWLETAQEEGSHHLVYLRVDPQLDELRGQPRFAALLRAVGLDHPETTPPTLQIGIV